VILLAVPALIGGNAIVIKPSEVTPLVGAKAAAALAGEIYTYWCTLHFIYLLTHYMVDDIPAHIIYTYVWVQVGPKEKKRKINKMHIDIQIDIYVYIHTYIHTYIYIYTYIYTCINIYIYSIYIHRMYIYIYIHTSEFTCAYIYCGNKKKLEKRTP